MDINLFLLIICASVSHYSPVRGAPMSTENGSGEAATETKTAEYHEPISYMDTGFLYKFVSVTLLDGSQVDGQVIGVYNERPFMWHPVPRDTFAIFQCGQPNRGPDSFSTNYINSANAVFTLHTDEILTIKVVRPPPDATTYTDYLRAHDVTIHRQPIEGEDVYILTDWSTYHTWEDGRSNYAWDLASLNTNMMTYTGYGTRLTNFAVWNKAVYLPFSGTVSKVMRLNPDNPPDLTAAIQFEELDNGNEASLDEKPNNGVEVTPGGPFLMRILHQKYASVPASIIEGQFLEAGAYVGTVGNSGTTYTPHIHMVFGFTDQNGRYWSTPIEWQGMEQRALLPFPAAYEYGSYKYFDYGFPKLNHCVKIV